MRGILADVNGEGQLQVLIGIFESEAWRELWTSLKLPVRTVTELGLPRNVCDVILWQKCQADELVLVTGNRNQEGAESLEATIRGFNTSRSLPVFTLSHPKRIRVSSSTPNEWPNACWTIS